MKHRLLFIFPLLCLTGCLSIHIGSFCGFVPVTYERQTHLSVPMSANQTLTARTSDGYIKVKGQPEPTCYMEATIIARAKTDERARDLANHTDIQLARRNNGLEVVVTQPNRHWGESIDISYDMVVCQQTSLNLRSSDGNITIENVTGDIQSKTSDGHIHLHHVTGSLDIQTSDGNIGANDLHTGQMTLRTSDGHIDVTRCDAGQAHIRSSDGNLHLKDVAIGSLTGVTSDGSMTVQYSPQASGTLYIDLKASDGNINLTLPQDVSAQVYMHTSDGGYHLDRPMNMTQQSQNHINGVLGDGLGKISLKTSDGSIYLQ